jgi:hypothetical protein
MSATVLSQLEASVAAVQRESGSEGTLTDSSEALSDFCLLLERAFNNCFKNRTAVLGEKRDYWAFFQAAFEKSSVQALLKKIQTSNDNKTTIGKARNFIRKCLMNQSLGNVLQVWVFSISTNILLGSFPEEKNSGAILLA